jgi:hypothetical protein
MNYNPKPLPLQNLNNKLLCQAFVEINLAPKEKFEEKHRQLRFVLPNGAIVQLLDVQVLSYQAISDIYTIPATGMQEGDFRRWWEKSNPGVTDDTLMGIYYYRRSE